MSSEVFKTDRVPEIWTGRRRMEKPKRLEPLPEVVPIWEHGFDGLPDAVRVSFKDGSTAVYDIRRDQPHPLTVKCVETIRKWNVETIRKWNGYNNQPMRRRRKP